MAVKTECVQCAEHMRICLYCRYSLTHIAVDWQVISADYWSYDVLFIGTGQPLAVISVYELIFGFVTTEASSSTFCFSAENCKHRISDA